MLVRSCFSVGGLALCSPFASRPLALLGVPVRPLLALVAKDRHRPLSESGLCPLASRPSFGPALRASDPVERGYPQHITAQAPAFKLGLVISVSSILPSLNMLSAGVAFLPRAPGKRSGKLPDLCEFGLSKLVFLRRVGRTGPTAGIWARHSRGAPASCSFLAHPPSAAVAADTRCFVFHALTPSSEHKL